MSERLKPPRRDAFEAEKFQGSDKQPAGCACVSLHPQVRLIRAPINRAAPPFLCLQPCPRTPLPLRTRRRKEEGGARRIFRELHPCNAGRHRVSVCICSCMLYSHVVVDVHCAPRGRTTLHFFTPDQSRRAKRAGRLSNESQTHNANLIGLCEALPFRCALRAPDCC